MSDFTPDEIIDRNGRINDCLLEFDIAPTDINIQKVVDNITPEINATALEWGWNDTVVGDDICKLIRDHLTF